METSGRFCPECGAEESGYFCRSCGALVSGEDRVLCPRCHHIVPAGKFCNQCGQSVSGIGLNLRQLAMAGDTFWVTSNATVPTPASSGQEGEEPALRPDESVQLSQAELPDWLAELPADRPPEPPGAEQRLYPKLGPIESESRPISQRGFMFAVIGLMLIMLLGLVFMIVFLMLRGG
jgi:hypothetical protein